MIGIINWQFDQCTVKGVDFRFNAWAQYDTGITENPDVVNIATGVYPHAEVLKAGNTLDVSSWDIISSGVKPGPNVLIYENAGDHAALQAADVIARSGMRVEIITPDRT